MGKSDKAPRECTVFDNGLVEVACGTMNSVSSNVVYLTMKCWLCPSDNVDGRRVCAVAERSLRKNVSSIICGKGGFGKDYILDFDVVSDNMAKNVKRFLLVESFFTYSGFGGIDSARLYLSEVVPGIVGDLVFDLESGGLSVSRKK